ncbi:MAG: hypothetical protein Q8869_00295 [Candidatus Phytoplasma australasiaticum]|nr:hypothetical protein [Candidatus Phytoplasma australasiaticum]
MASKELLEGLLETRILGLGLLVFEVSRSSLILFFSRSGMEMMLHFFVPSVVPIRHLVLVPLRCLVSVNRSGIELVVVLRRISIREAGVHPVYELLIALISGASSGGCCNRGCSGCGGSSSLRFNISSVDLLLGLLREFLGVAGVHPGNKSFVAVISRGSDAGGCGRGCGSCAGGVLRFDISSINFLLDLFREFFGVARLHPGDETLVGIISWSVCRSFNLRAR